MSESKIEEAIAALWAIAATLADGWVAGVFWFFFWVSIIPAALYAVAESIKRATEGGE